MAMEKIKFGRKPKEEKEAEASASGSEHSGESEKRMVQMKPRDDGEEEPSAQEQMDTILRGLLNLRESMQRSIVTGMPLNVIPADYRVMSSTLAVMSNIEPETAKEFIKEGET